LFVAVPAWLVPFTVMPAQAGIQYSRRDLVSLGNRRACDVYWIVRLRGR